MSIIVVFEYHYNQADYLVILYILTSAAARLNICTMYIYKHVLILGIHGNGYHLFQLGILKTWSNILIIVDFPKQGLVISETKSAPSTENRSNC